MLTLALILLVVAFGLFLAAARGMWQVRLVPDALLAAGLAAQALAVALVVVPAPTPEPPEPPVEGDDFGGYRPHYQGFGAQTAGGRTGGTRTCQVTTLILSGTPTWGATGDVADCLAGVPPGCTPMTGSQAACARVVTFGVSGTIDLGGQQLAVTAPWLTIAGQTAPTCAEGTGPDTCATGAGGVALVNGRLVLDTHTVVLQHLRLRRSTPSICMLNVGEGGDGGDNSHVHDVVLDHVSVSWSDRAANLCVAANGGTNRVLIVDSLFGEAFYTTGINVGIYMHHTCAVTVARSLFAHTWARNPMWGAMCRMGFYNNVIYNGADQTPGGAYLAGFAGSLDSDFGYWGLGESVVAHNAAIAGPDSGAAPAFLGLSMHPDSVAAGSRFYLTGNTGPGVTGATGDGQWTGTICGNYGANYTGAATCGPGSNVRTDTAFPWWTAWDVQILTDPVRAVQANAGARPLDRDAADARVTADVSEGDGTQRLEWADVVSRYGGYPPLARRERPVTLPANPEAPGTCGALADGTARTTMDCFLEHDPAFGAQRLEQPPPTRRGTQ